VREREVRLVHPMSQIDSPTVYDSSYVFLVLCGRGTLRHPRCHLADKMESDIMLSLGLVVSCSAEVRAPIKSDMPRLFPPLSNYNKSMSMPWR
jgi:hypothetical protein